MKFRFILIIPALFLLVFGTHLSAQSQFKMDESMTMAEFKEQALQPKEELWVVDFWASWCGPCMHSIPEVIRIHNKVQDKPVKFISISWDRNEMAWRQAVNRLQIPWAQILIPNIRKTPFINKEFPHKGIPALFLITREGKVKRVNEMNLEKKIGKFLKD